MDYNKSTGFIELYIVDISDLFKAEIFGRRVPALALSGLLELHQELLRAVVGTAPRPLLKSQSPSCRNRGVLFWLAGVRGVVAPPAVRALLDRDEGRMHQLIHSV